MRRHLAGNRAGRLLPAMATVCILLAAVMAAAGCGSGQTATTGTHPTTTAAATGTSTDIDTTASATTGSMTLTSTSLGTGSSFQQPQICKSKGGGDQSPELSWSGAPAGTAAFVVIMDDEDPPCGAGDDACRHWSVFNLPAGITSLKAGQDVSPLGAVVGQNYQGESAYAGPCSAQPHMYHITIYALSDTMDDVSGQTGLNRSQFQSRFGGLILDQGTLTVSFTP